MNTTLPLKLRVAAGIALVGMLCTAGSRRFAAADGPAENLTDARKLELILAGKNEFPRAYRIRSFEPEGQIDAVGRLVTIDGKVYFKTADQSYIPQGRRFPYPELLFELHLSEDYAYRPLIEKEMVRRRQALYEGPLRIRGNWAYERPYHIFGLVWVDKVTKADASPEADWSAWLKARNNTPRPSAQAR